jgi:NADP-dependent 3-hydroxy acid dehydrogenase YdfG
LINELDGRVAIVTGAARSIGEQDALKLSVAGARVLITDVDADADTAAATRGSYFRNLPLSGYVRGQVLPVSGGLLGGIVR